MAVIGRNYPSYLFANYHAIIVNKLKKTKQGEADGIWLEQFHLGLFDKCCAVLTMGSNYNAQSIELCPTSQR